MVRTTNPQYRAEAVTQDQLVVTSTILPAFEHASVSNDETSSIAAEYPFNNDYPFTIGIPLSRTLRNNVTFALAVRSTNPAGVTERYVLKSNYNVTLLFPTYSGQTIHANAVLEVWTGAGVDTAAELESDVTLDTNYLTQTKSNMAVTQVTPTDTTLVATVFTEVSTGPTNPFYDPLVLTGG